MQAYIPHMECLGYILWVPSSWVRLMGLYESGAFADGDKIHFHGLLTASV